MRGAKVESVVHLHHRRGRWKVLQVFEAWSDGNPHPFDLYEVKREWPKGGTAYVVREDFCVKRDGRFEEVPAIVRATLRPAPRRRTR